MDEVDSKRAETVRAEVLLLTAAILNASRIGFQNIPLAQLRQAREALECCCDKGVYYL